MLGVRDQVPGNSTRVDLYVMTLEYVPWCREGGSMMDHGETERQQEERDRAWLREKGQLRERPFSSTLPLLGPLIVRFRSLWNGVATKWYVRPLIQQQNEFNALLIQRLGDLEAQVVPQIIEQDREQTRLARETAELGLQISQLNRLLRTLEERLARLEEEAGAEDD